jgi:hypothetical protein
MAYLFGCGMVVSITISYLSFLLIQGPASQLSRIFKECDDTREGIKTFKFRFLQINKNLVPDEYSKTGELLFPKTS